MITVKDRRSYGSYRGKSPESIARRLYGRRAYVRYSADPSTPWQAYVCTPTPDWMADNVEADWYLDDDARAAAEPEDYR